jgi:DNA-binding transcriptional ArsR family regulator
MLGSQTEGEESMLNVLASDHDAVGQLVQALKTLSDPTRLRVLSLIQSGELNVTALCQRLQLPQPTVSHHLGLLREAGLVRARRSGKQVYYSLNDDTVSRIPDDNGIAISAGVVDLRLTLNGKHTVPTPQAPPLARPLAVAAV